MKKHKVMSVLASCLLVNSIAVSNASLTGFCYEADSEQYSVSVISTIETTTETTVTLENGTGIKKTTTTVSNQKPYISDDDILRLSEKGDELTWSDFEQYEYTNIGNKSLIWEFKIKRSGAKLQIYGSSLEEKPTNINYIAWTGAEVDIRTEDMTLWFCDDGEPDITTTEPVTTSTNAIATESTTSTIETTAVMTMPTTATTTTTTTVPTITDVVLKPYITDGDILRLSEKGDELTWSDFEQYEYTNIGNKSLIWEFKIKRSGAKLQIYGSSLEEKPTNINYIAWTGAEVDIRTEDMTLWFCDDGEPSDSSDNTVTTTAVIESNETTTTIATTTGISTDAQSGLVDEDSNVIIINGTSTVMTMPTATTTTTTTTSNVTTTADAETVSSSTTTETADSTSLSDSQLPQTGYSNIYKVIAGIATLMTVSGTALIVKTKKENE